MTNLIKQKQKELVQIETEIRQFTGGNPQQQRKCVRLKEDYEKLKQEIQVLKDNQKEQTDKLDDIRKKIDSINKDDKHQKRKRQKLQKEYEALRKTIGDENELLKIGESKENDKNDAAMNNSSSVREKENNFDVYSDFEKNEKNPKHDQFGVHEQERTMNLLEQRMQKRKQITSQAEDVVTVGVNNLCEIENDLIYEMKLMNENTNKKYELELQKICALNGNEIEKLRKQIFKLESLMENVSSEREKCVTITAHMNLTTKRILFDMIGCAVFILRNTLYMMARTRDFLFSYTATATNKS